MENNKNSRNGARRLKPKERRKTLLKAAAELFFEKGYTATSLDDIIARAGGSRRSIYSEFENKEGLFRALVEEKTEVVMAMLNMPDSGAGDLGDTLRQLSRQIMTLLAQPESVGLMRVAVSESLSVPEFAQRYYETGPQKAEAGLAAVLEAGRQRGEISVADSAEAATLFIGMLRDRIYVDTFLRRLPTPAPEEIARITEEAVRIFLYGILPRKQ